MSRVTKMPPPDVLASWPTPNYTHPHTHGPAATIVGFLTFAMAFFAVLLRYWAQWQRAKQFNMDDLLIGLAFIHSGALTSVSTLIEYTYKWDRHTWDFPPWVVSTLLKFGFGTKLVYTVGTALTRLSLYALYYRLVQPWGVELYNWMVYIGIGFNVTALIIFACLNMFLCWPISYYWQFPRIPGQGHCLDDGVVMFVLGTVNLVADVVAFLTPLPLIWQLPQIPTKKKIGVTVLFSLGLVAVGAGCLRAYYMWVASFGTWDGAWWAYDIWMTGTVEINIGVVCACAPLLRQSFENTLDLFVKLLDLRLHVISRHDKRRVPEIALSSPSDTSRPYFSSDGGPGSTLSDKSGLHGFHRISNTHEAEWEAYLKDTQPPQLPPNAYTVHCTGSRRVMGHHDRRPSVAGPNEIWKHEEFELTVTRV